MQICIFALTVDAFFFLRWTPGKMNKSEYLSLFSYVNTSGRIANVLTTNAPLIIALCFLGVKSRLTFPI